MKQKDKKWALLGCNLLHPVIFARMRSAGSNEKVFDPEAKSLIHDYVAGSLAKSITSPQLACSMRHREIFKESTTLLSPTPWPNSIFHRRTL